MFGIPEAPRLWWLRALEVITEAGFETVRACAGLFVLRDRGRLVGVLALHVDDAMWAGAGRRFEKPQKHIRDDPSLAQEASGTFTFWVGIFTRTRSTTPWR